MLHHCKTHGESSNPVAQRHQNGRIYMKCRKCVKEWRHNSYLRNKKRVLTQQHAYRAKNRERRNAAHREAYRLLTPEQKRARASMGWRKHKYGLSTDDYNRMLATQGGVCAICLHVERRRHRYGTLDVDHCHKTGVNRGLLCHQCNTLIAFADEDPGILLRAISYLERHGMLKAKA